MKDAIIWRKSIFENDYVCRCGKKLMSKGKIAKDIVEEMNYLICPSCNYLVAKLSTIEDAEKEGAISADN